jgi:hypothetical protein
MGRRTRPTKICNLWRGSFGSVNDLRADGNGHGTVDAADFVIWRKSFGAGSAAAAIPSGSQVAVPEPHALILSIWFLATPVGQRLPCPFVSRGARNDASHSTNELGKVSNQVYFQNSWNAARDLEENL